MQLALSLSGAATSRRPVTGLALSVSWNDTKVGFASAVALALLLAVSSIPPAIALGRLGGDFVGVIVREVPGAGSRPEALVEAVGGHVERQLPIISGFSARVPASAVVGLAHASGILSVTPDARVRLLSSVDGFDASTDIGSMHTTARMVGATSYWSAGYTGKGVDVALIDSGVVPVEGLTVPGKVVNGPDLSFESGLDNLRYLDTYGHGTHMAGIIAGRDGATLSLKSNELKNAYDSFLGIAPDARIVNVKVAGHSGATDVSQVIAALDWVVQNGRSNGLDVRIINLSFGTDGVQDYLLDPLTYAVEVAWHKGIVVVVAAGNSGYGTAKLNNPAYDPYILAVGASDPKGTMGSADDEIPSFSSRGDGLRNPDLVAPGKSLVSLRAAGSYIDEKYTSGQVNARFFRGSGTSQAAAVASGIAALVIQQRPTITPDQVKAMLMARAKRLPSADQLAQGAGMVFLDSGALLDPPPLSVQKWPRATGLGSLELARGTAHVSIDGVTLVGEQTVFGTAWDGNSWSGNSWSGNSWSGGSWSGNSWSGSSWSGGQWLGNSWSGSTWNGSTWSGSTWSGNTWSGNSWSGSTWSGSTWSGSTWSGSTWSGSTWSRSSWSAEAWQ